MTNGDPAGGQASGTSTNPLQVALNVLNAARNAVPAVNYALGLAGLAAAAIIAFFLGHTKAGVIIIGLVFYWHGATVRFFTISHRQKSFNQFCRRYITLECSRIFCCIPHLHCYRLCGIVAAPLGRPFGHSP